MVDRVEQRDRSTRIGRRVRYTGDLKALADYLEDVPGCEVLSLGHSLEIVKDLGDAQEVSSHTGSPGFEGTHAIGHVRMATESDVDISGAHPYWAYPFSDIAVVHNGQLTNYFQWKRRLERIGPPVPVRVRLGDHRRLPGREDGRRAPTWRTRWSRAWRTSTASSRTWCVTEDALGVAKDEMAAKPLVLYESDELVAMASEEIAIRAVIGHEIDTYDPYEGEVLVWTRYRRAGRLRRPRAGRARRARSPHGLARSTARAPCSTRPSSPPGRSTSSCAAWSTSRASRRHGAEPRRQALDRRRASCRAAGSRFEGSLGYFGVGLIDGPEIHITGRVGWSVCENMMSGVVVIEKNAGSLTGAALRGGDIVVNGAGRRPDRHRPEGRHDHRRRRRRHDDRRS